MDHINSKDKDVTSAAVLKGKMSYIHNLLQLLRNAVKTGVM